MSKVLTSAVILVFKIKLLVTTALNFAISAKLSTVFLVKPAIWFSILVTLVLSSVFLTTSFLTTLVNLAKSAGVVFNLSTSILSTSLFKAAKLVLVA